MLSGGSRAPEEHCGRALRNESLTTPRPIAAYSCAMPEPRLAPTTAPTPPAAGAAPRGRLAALLLLALSAVAAPAHGAPVPPQDEAELAALLAREREEADLMRRRGNPRSARKLLSEHLADDPNDAASRTLLARIRMEAGEYDKALRHGERALADAIAAGGPFELRAACARTLAETQLMLGRYVEALHTLESIGGALAPEADARDAWALGRALWEGGDRDGARRIFRLGVSTSNEQSWKGLVAKAACERAVGRLERASKTLVLADEQATSEGGEEPDVLVALADLYFESEREVDVPGKRPAGELYKAALTIHPTHAGGLLGLFELHRYNRRRTSRTPAAILAELLTAAPSSIDGLLAGASADLEDGRLREMRTRLDELRLLAPNRRELRTLEAALAWVEHKEEQCEAILAELLRESPEDSRPEREVGRHLLELYRFAEGLPFLRRAVERAPSDYEAWTQLGRALANTGDEDAARAALAKAKSAARGRQDAWRNNMTLVLKRMKEVQVVESSGELTFAWRPDAADILREYLVPFYTAARSELAERYGYTPGPTRIEVFRRHKDWSVRSVGFEGFPALGVCFGPVVTALSPLCELRGSFSWARTGFHEFSHVIHLGLSHNRCPRWITEGLATWEEVNRNPTWTRNMRRELVDARANGDLILVRDLNRAFRGGRILFGYYEGGLLCRMLIDEHGFQPMIHLLEAFDRGLDLDQAFEEVFDTTPEAVDEAFRAFVDDEIAALAIEPRWTRKQAVRLRIGLAREVPAAGPERDQWADDVCTLAWSAWQAGRLIDAQEALRRLDRAGLAPLRGQFLRGEMALARGDEERARELWEAAVAAGGREFRALVGLGSLQQRAGELERAQRTYLLAEAAFPGYDDSDLSAELRLVELYLERGEPDEAMGARERWLAWNAGEYGMRLVVAGWHVAADRHAEAVELFAQANEVDPFHRALHEQWARSLRALERHEEALRELRVARILPHELDADLPGPLAPEDEAELLALAADSLRALGREDASRTAALEALELDPDCELALELMSSLK